MLPKFLHQGRKKSQVLQLLAMECGIVKKEVAEKPTCKISEETVLQIFISEMIFPDLCLEKLQYVF